MITVLLLAITIFACVQAQTPPTGLPLTFYTKLRFTYVNKSFYPERVTYVKDQEIASDFVNKQICRWNQRQIQPIANFSADWEFCNYAVPFGKNFRWHLHEFGCVPSPAVPSEFPMLNYPREIQTAQYLGRVPVNGVMCDHWSKVLFINVRINIDIYTNGDTPCQVSVNYLDVKGMNWIFDNFSTQIPPNAFDNCNLKHCKEVKSCKHNPNASTVQLQAALDGACGYIDCSPINPGGEFQNDTFIDKVDFAVSQYYSVFSPTGGDKSCYWGGAATIVYEPPPQDRNSGKRSFPKQQKPLPKFVGDDDFLLFVSNIVCDDGETPWLNYS